MPTILFLTLLACTETRTTHQTSISSEGVWTVFGTLESGDFAYRGGSKEEIFTAELTTWGKAGTAGRAERRESLTNWSIDREEDSLAVTASGTRKNGLDVDLRGPSVLSVDVVTGEGAVTLEAVDGWHSVIADRIEAREVYGDADFVSRFGGMDVGIYPYDGSEVWLTSEDGDVVLELPAGLPYDIEVFGDPDYGIEVTDLGFADFLLYPDYFAARSGSGAIEISVVVSGGSFVLLPAP